MEEREVQKIYSCAEVAKRFGVTTKTVWRWIQEGRLKAIRIGDNGNYRIKQEHLDEFEKSCEQ